VLLLHHLTFLIVNVLLLSEFPYTGLIYQADYGLFRFLIVVGWTVTDLCHAVTPSRLTPVWLTRLRLRCDLTVRVDVVYYSLRYDCGCAAVAVVVNGGWLAPGLRGYDVTCWLFALFVVVYRWRCCLDFGWLFHPAAVCVRTHTCILDPVPGWRLPFTRAFRTLRVRYRLLLWPRFTARVATPAAIHARGLLRFKRCSDLPYDVNTRSHFTRFHLVGLDWTVHG